MEEALGDPPVVQRTQRRSVRLSDRTRARLASAAREYVEDLVESCEGDHRDVQSIIRELDADLSDRWRLP
jgi:DNA-binding transcriptional regulator PaaX